MANYDISGLRVLIVDDHEPMRLILKSVVRALGIREIQEAAGGEQALKILEDSEVDLIFSYYLRVLIPFGVADS